MGEADTKPNSKCATGWDKGKYVISDMSELMTPALAVYPEIAQSNIAYTVELLGGNPSLWRPHIKTAKLAAVLRMLVERGIERVKCVTTLELKAACLSGIKDILLAYPAIGANACRVKQIAQEFAALRISALIEVPEQVDLWKGSKVGLFVDINPGMDRTGIEQSNFDKILATIMAIQKAKIDFRGLHYYDGHLRTLNLQHRIAEAHLGYDRLCQIVKTLQIQGISIAEVNTSSTPTLPAVVDYKGFRDLSLLHSVSPGTIVYGDMTSTAQLPKYYRYRPAALIISRVVSSPRRGIITCDAGHKTLSVDSGVPNCFILGRADFRPLQPSEEHLPVEVPATATPAPRIGETLYLVPQHVCPTINNFDHALFVRNSRIESVEQVSARGREFPIVAASDKSGARTNC